MTVASTANRKSYAGDGSTTAFTFPYLFLANADLKVILVAADGTETPQTITTHYTLTGAGEPSGGTVTMLTAPAADETLVIYRDPETTQGLDLVTNDALPADAVEEAFDKLTMLAQRTRELVNRSVHLTDGDDDLDMILPPVVDRAGKYLGFDENGLPSAVAGAGDATPISAYGATLVIAADAGAARTVLGLGTMAVETATDYPTLAGTDTLTGAKTFTSNITVRKSAGGATHILHADHATPSTFSGINFDQDNSDGDETIMAQIQVVSSDTTAGSEDAVTQIRSRVAGTLATRWNAGAGVWTEGAVGGDPGPGGFNASGYQQGGVPFEGASAWVNFNGTGTVAIRDSLNVTSVTDNGTGNYTVNLTAAVNANLPVLATAANADASSTEAPYASAVLGSAATIRVGSWSSQNVSAARDYAFLQIGVLGI